MLSRWVSVASAENSTAPHPVRSLLPKPVCVFADQDQPEGRGPTIENLQKKIKRLESDLEKRPEKKDVKDDHGKVATWFDSTWNNILQELFALF